MSASRLGRWEATQNQSGWGRGAGSGEGSPGWGTRACMRGDSLNQGITHLSGESPRMGAGPGPPGLFGGVALTLWPLISVDRLRTLNVSV